MGPMKNWRRTLEPRVDPDMVVVTTDYSEEIAELEAEREEVLLRIQGVRR